MMIKNINVIDGLVNGATGVLKFITFKQNSKKIEILWFDFESVQVLEYLLEVII